MLKSLLYFAGGVLIGSIGSWYLLEERYREAAEAESEAMKVMYEKKIKSMSTSEETPSELYDEKNDDGRVDYASIYRTATDRAEEEAPVEEFYGIRVIDTDEYAEHNGYDKIILHYYIDGSVTNDEDELINSEAYIGDIDVYENIGNFEPHVLHVRNDTISADFEIIEEGRRFDDY